MHNAELTSRILRKKIPRRSTLRQRRGLSVILDYSVRPRHESAARRTSSPVQGLCPCYRFRVEMDIRRERITIFHVRCSNYFGGPETSLLGWLKFMDRSRF